MSRSRAPRLIAVSAMATAVAATVISLMVAPAASALATRTGNDVVVGSGEVVHDDLYAAAQNVTIRGKVDGDLVVAANTVRIEGTVTGDLTVVAATVVITGTVGDDVRGAAASIRVEGEGRVGGDLLAATYSLETTTAATIGGDVAYTGYQAVLNGETAGDVLSSTAALVIGGHVGGRIDAVVGSGDRPTGSGAGVPGAVTAVQPGFRLTDGARVDGDVTYRSPAKAVVSPGAQVAGNIVFHRTSGAGESRTSRVASRVLGALRLLMTLLVAGVLLTWLAPRRLAAATGALRRRPWWSLGLGVAAFVAVGVSLSLLVFATVVLAVLFGVLTLGGLVWFVVGAGVLGGGLIAFLTAVTAALLAPIVVSSLAGRLVLRRPVTDGLGSRVLSLLVGVAIYVVLRAVPVFGSLVTLVVTLLGVGALVIATFARGQERPSGPPSVPADRSGPSIVEALPSQAMAPTA